MEFHRRFYDRILRLVEQGVQYTLHGDHPQIGFDCSGFVGYMLQSVGINISRPYVATLKDRCQDLPDPRWGDINIARSLAFAFAPAGQEFNHVGICLPNDGFRTNQKLGETDWSLYRPEYIAHSTTTPYAPEIPEEDRRILMEFMYAAEAAGVTDWGADYYMNKIAMGAFAQALKNKVDALSDDAVSTYIWGYHNNDPAKNIFSWNDNPEKHSEAQVKLYYILKQITLYEEVLHAMEGALSPGLAFEEGQRSYANVNQAGLPVPVPGGGAIVPVVIVTTVIELIERLVERVSDKLADEAIPDSETLFNARSALLAVTSRLQQPVKTGLRIDKISDAWEVKYLKYSPAYETGLFRELARPGFGHEASGTHIHL